MSPFSGVPRPEESNAVTDERGRYSFPALAAGRYSVETHHADYFDAAYAVGTAAVARRTTIVLTDGQHFTASIALSGVASISGRVTDEAGAPVADAIVQLLLTHAMFGADHEFAGPSVATNPRGEYAFESLRADSYRVMVTSTVHTRASTKTEPVSPQVFFQDARAIAAALPIVVRPGESRSDVDVVRPRVTGHRVSGRLSGRAETFVGLMLRLVPDGLMDLGSRGDAATTIVNRDGTFTFLNVPEGDYILVANRAAVEFNLGLATASLPKPPGVFLSGPMTSRPLSADRDDRFSYAVIRQAGPAYAGHQRLSVASKDVDDVVVDLQPTASVRVGFDESAGFAPLRLSLSFEPVNPPDLQPFVGWVDSRTNTIDGIPPGEYVIHTDQVADRMFFGDDDVLGRSIVIGAGANPPLRVRAIRYFASLTGVVKDQKGVTVPGANVLLLPADFTRWRDGGDIMARPVAQADTAGVVNMGTIPPGNYLAIAVRPDQSVWSPSADFLRVARSSAAKVTLIADQKAVAVIPLLSLSPR